MRSRTLLFLRAALAVVVVWPLGAAAQQPGRTRLFTDTATVVGSNAALSPDGKWLAFAVQQAPAKAHIVVTRAGAGAVQPITNAGWWDSSPQWSPSGDRLYFVSNRTAREGTPHYHAMSIEFDPATGRAVGEPRQVGQDAVMGGSVRVSPDGRALAYVSSDDRRLLKVVPVSGGESRVVTRMPARSGNIAWSRDGQHLYFITNVGLQTQRVLNRVPAGGGEITTALSDLPPRGQLLLGPGAETFIVTESGDGRRDNLFRMYDHRGAPIRTITANRNTRVTQFTLDGRALVAIEADVVAPTRILPIEGGAHRDVTPPVAYDWVMRWSPDGRTLYTWTDRDGAAVLAAIPLEGGEVKTFPESEEWGAEGANSRYLFQASGRNSSSPRSLVAVDLRDASRHTISASVPGSRVLAYGPGGTWGAHEELYYFEQRGDVLDVKAWRGPGDMRTLRSLPASLLGTSSIAVHGDRVVWQQERGDSVDLMIAESSEGEPRRLLTMHAMPGTNEFAFSNDGKVIALHFSRGPGSPDLMAFVDPAGAAPPRVVETGLAYWYWPRWLPDDSGVLVVGGGAGAEADIVRIPVAERQQVVNLTRDQPGSKWGFEISPDGRFIAYPSEIWRGSSIWRIDIAGDAR